ncbi:hypothetical protein ACHAWO_008551 [Cyclotella atomus]|uniref:Plastid lipid-associated protein/fibrillin conserved domain-containing protein n=1 Tax=Cyclotella atomus TaxID=382360 RepID=A0ABD3PK07_9STRA
MSLFVFLITAIIVGNVSAFSASNTALLSRLQTIQAELLISIGRIPGTAMPPEWAASGAKLGFALEVEFTDEPCEYEMTKERLLKSDALMGTKLLSVEPLNVPTFVSTKGKETIKVKPGAYGCQIQGLESRQYAFRFFLDFPEGSKRNDVELPAEKIYFLSSCWLLPGGEDSSLERARRRRDDLVTTIRQISDEVDQVERQLADANILQREMEKIYPLDSSKVIQGPNEIIFAKEGVVAVKRFRGTLGTKEQYHWIGTFTFNEFFEDDEGDG